MAYHHCLVLGYFWSHEMQAGCGKQQLMYKVHGGSRSRDIMLVQALGSSSWGWAPEQCSRSIIAVGTIAKKTADLQSRTDASPLAAYGFG